MAPTQIHQLHSGVLSRRYRNALALNNIGVQFLTSRRSYAQACDAFQEAAVLMRTVLQHVGEEISAPSSIQADGSGDEIVHRATRQLVAQKSPTDKTVLTQEVLTATQEGSLINYEELLCGNNVSLEACPRCLHSVLQAPVRSHSSAFPIRLEENLLVEEPTFLEQHHQQQAPCSAALRLAVIQQMAITQHNLAIAKFCYSRTCDAESPLRREQLLSALRLSGSAVSAILQEHLTHMQQQEESEQDNHVFGFNERTDRLPCLLIALISSLIHLLQLADQPEKAKKFFSILERCRSLVKENEGLTRVAPGAAAA